MKTDDTLVSPDGTRYKVIALEGNYAWLRPEPGTIRDLMQIPVFKIVVENWQNESD